MPQNEFGHEIPDPTPVAVPSGFKRPETLAEQVRRLVRSEQWRLRAEEVGVETFEESNDFDLPDDPIDPSTPFEPYFDPFLGSEVTPHDILREQKAVQTETERRFVANQAQDASKRVRPSPVPPQPEDQEPAPEPSQAAVERGGTGA